MKLKCEVERLNWTTAYSYKTKDDELVELTLPFESMKALCLKHNVYPIDGAGEVQYAAFSDWMCRHRRTREVFYGKEGFDIQSLVNLLDADLKGTAKLWDGGESNIRPRLKPCPFCGGEVELRIVGKQANGGEEWYVGCENVNCSLHPHSTTPYASARIAAEAWNRRAEGGAP